ncbi:MAG: hypothetical protein M0P55_04255 [Clostridiales bacterium]|nr:hypothetical protein [Clostridiales bacterium]
MFLNRSLLAAIILSPVIIIRGGNGAAQTYTIVSAISMNIGIAHHSLDTMLRENKEQSKPFRKMYLDSILSLIAQRQERCNEKRSLYVNPAQMAAEPERCRSELKQLLGWPLTDEKPGCQPALRLIPVTTTDMATIKRVQIEVFDNFWFYGLLVMPSQYRSKMPLVICQHGGYGTPELACGLHGDNHYDDIVWRLVEKQVVVFLPQMLLWREAEEDQDCFPGYGLPYNRVKIDAQFKQVGSSITALEVYCLIRSLDALQFLAFIDCDHVGMTGLSYGGFYTLMTSALEPRIRAGYASAFFNDRVRYNWPDFTWFGSACCFLDAEIAALVAPRALYLEVGRQDPVFDFTTAVKEYERLKPFYEAQKAKDMLVFSVIDKAHRYDDRDVGLDFLLKHIVD